MSLHKICILSSQHVPDDIRITHRIAKRLREEGHEVTWVGPKRSRSGDDYGIRFVYYPPAKNKIDRLTLSTRLLKTARSTGPHAVYFAAEPDSAAVAVKLARENHGRAIFDIHEIYHEEMLLRWVPRLFVGIVGKFVQWRIRQICRSCDLVVGVGQTRLDPYLSCKSTAGMLVRHCVPRSFVPSPGVGPFPSVRPDMVIMHGKITMSHGTAEVMKAVAILRHEHHIPCRIIMLKERVEMPGFADTPVGKLAQELGISECLDLRDPVPFKAMFPLMQTCDVGVIAYQRTFGRKCMPNRVFEYMAVGLPVIVPSYAEEMQRIVPKYECGIMCDTENPQELSNALRGLWMNKTEAKRMGSNGRKAFEAGLNWEEESRPLMEWIRNNAAR